MPRAIWSGAISFGLVAVPVKLYPATEQKDIRFHQFKEGTDQRIKYRRVTERTGREVDYEDIVKGYEVETGKYIIVTPEELEGVAPEKSRTIEIEDFVEMAQIDPIFFEKTYYLAPAADAGAEKAYALLLKTMESEEMVGIGRFVMRTKEYLAAIRPKDNVLVLETMYFPDEIRGVGEVENVPVRRQVNDRELKMARQLVGSLATDWDPKKYHDEYRERVLKLIRDKAKGKEVVLPEAPTATKVADIMDALRLSIEATRKGKRPADVAEESEAKAERGDEGAASGDLASLSKGELLERAAKKGIAGRTKMKKDQLVRALKRAS
jgi:DNA end-binding protein Ku